MADLSELIGDIRKYNVGSVEAAVKIGRSMKSVRINLGTGQGKMYALKDKKGNAIGNCHDIVIAAEGSTLNCTVFRAGTLPSFEAVMNRIQRLLL